eukprot:gene15662-6182_t
MVLIIYGVPLSQPVRAVLWACLIKRLPFKLQMIAPGMKISPFGSRSPEYLAINPTGTIPAINDDGVIVFESNAILTYLANKYGWYDLYPTDLEARAKVDQYLHWHHQNTREFAVRLFAPNVRKDLKFPPGHVEGAKIVIPRVLKHIEGWLTKTDFVAGPSLTLADIVMFQEVGQVKPEHANLWDMTGQVVRALYPALQAWFSRMKQVPYYSEINVVSKELGDLTKDVPQKTIATANKRGIKAVVAAAARVSKL